MERGKRIRGRRPNLEIHQKKVADETDKTDGSETEAKNEENEEKEVKEENEEKEEKEEKGEKEEKAKKEEKEENEKKSTEIKKEIAELPDDPKEAEGKIRAISEKIKALTDAKIRQELEFSLKKVAERGLDKDLKPLLGKTGLTFDMALILVLNHLTDKVSLAQYLYETPKKTLSEKGLEMVRRKLGPELEVLGGLKAKGIDTSRPWVARLIEIAPSFFMLSHMKLQELCKQLEEGESQPKIEQYEKEVVGNLINIAKAKERDSEFPPDEQLAEKNEKKKQEQEENLKKAKELMSEAEEMASTALFGNKEKLAEQIQEISKKLELPPDWYKQDKIKPQDALKHLNEEISKFEEYIETRPRYNSLEEVAAKASGGRALTGVRYSEYSQSVTAGLPILEPPSKVESMTTSVPFESKFLKFTSEKAAADFVNNVDSSGFNIAVAVTGFYGAFVGSASIAYGSDESTESSHQSTSSTTSASVTHHIRIGTQAFQIRRDYMQLRKEAKKNALLIAGEKDAEKQKGAARQFFDRYGTHIPCGVHNLGGIFFTTANARSEKGSSMQKLTHQAVSHLSTKVSFGFVGAGFGIGASETHESKDSHGETSAHQEESESVSYTYSLKSIGPNADSPGQFKKLLSNNNSTWAILDRGSQSTYVPVWELFQELGEKEYETAASVMKETWNEEEQELKKGLVQEGKKDFMKKLIGVGSVVSLRKMNSKEFLNVIQSEEDTLDTEYVDYSSKVWAPFNGFYYPAKIESLDTNNMHIKYDDEDERDFQPREITTIIPDKVPDQKAVQEGSEVIAQNREEKHRKYRGIVTEVKDSRYKVLFTAGGIEDFDLKDIRLMPNGSSLFRVLKFVGNKLVLSSLAFPEYVICATEEGEMKAKKKNQTDQSCQFEVQLHIKSSPWCEIYARPVSSGSFSDEFEVQLLSECVSQQRCWSSQVY